MTHSEKVARLVSGLRAKGINQYTTAPPMFRTLWALGVEVPPPFSIHFFPLALLGGLPFGAGMAVFFWLYGLPHLLVPSTIGGALFGLTMSGYFRWKAKALKLPTWESYGISN
jgi:hypothetical protein